jgi:hypothetical protein
LKSIETNPRKEFFEFWELSRGDFMQIIGLASVVLFLASLAAFLTAFMYPSYMTTGGVLGALFLAAAAVILGISIRSRNKTERI